MNTDSTIVARLIGAIKDQQADIAEAAMMKPVPELFECGVRAGRYQGLQTALEILESILRDDEDKEKFS